jgi:hypothetical protein
LPDIYGVLPDEVAAELRGLFPANFDVDTVPTEAQVIDWISTADSVVALHLVDSAGQQPALTDAAARIVKTYIRNWVKAEVVKTVYAGQDPLAIKTAAGAYSDTADMLLTELDQMGSQAVGTGLESARVAVAYTVPDRDLVVTDDELGRSEEFARTRKY